MHDNAITQCPKCLKNTLRRIISGGAYCFVKKGTDEIKVGHLANRNRDSFSEDQKEHILTKNSSKAMKKKPQPWYREHQTKTNSQVAAMTPDEKDHYIEHGT